MAIPDYQALMLPLLSSIGDGQEHLFKDLVDELANQHKLTDDERKQLLPSGGTFTFSSRVSWARTYMKKAGLVDQPKRGCMLITERGKQVLASKPKSINVKFLEQFPEFIAFRDNQKSDIPSTIVEPAQTSTPEEMLEDTHRKLNSQLANELLEIVKSSSPAFFERLVVSLLVKMGYGGTLADAARVIGRSGDEGIDGIINEDRLGLDAIYIQAKRWEAVIGRPEIQKFVGALQGQRAHKGVFITTSDFTKEAQEYVKNISNKVVLLNGLTLARLMIENNVGVSVAAVYEVKKIDSDYFVDE